VKAIRRGNEDVRLGRLADLLGDPDATVDGRDPECAGMDDRSSLVDDLARQLTRWGQHERRRPGILGGDPLAQGDRKGERLPGPGGRLCQHVAPGESVADHQALDRKGGLEAAVRERTGHGFGHAEIGERLR
jgi:hypothetical protein